MEKTIAKIISIIFHPIFIPTYGVFYILNINYFYVSANTLLLIIGLMVITTVIFPIISIYIYNRQNLIHNFEMVNQEDRTYPYVIMTITYFLLFYLFQRIRLPLIFNKYLLTSGIICVSALIINIKFKISIHLMAFGGLTGILIGIAYKLHINNSLIIYSTILLSGIIGYCRLYLNAHKPVEVYWGYLSGMFIGIIIFLF